MDLYEELFSDPATAVSLIAGLVVLAILMTQQYVGRWFQQIQSRHGDVPSSCRLSGFDVTTRLLLANGLKHIPVKQGSGSNHYHPRKREIHLTAATANGTSLAALATAAHEVGHACHFAEGIWQCRLRQILWPVCWSLVPLAAAYGVLMAFAIVPFSLSALSLVFLLACLLIVVFQAPISLPLETDASGRARKMVTRHGFLAAHERPAFERLLRAAWRTHAVEECQRWVVLVALAGGMLLVSGSSLWDSPVNEPVAMNHIAPATDESARDYHGMPDVTGIMGQLLGLILVVVLSVWIARYMNIFNEKPKKTPSREQRAVQINNDAMDFLEKGQPRESIEKFSESLELNPQASVVWHNRGQAHLASGDFRAAIADFNRSLDLEPGFMQAVAGRGKARFALGDFARACQDARLAVTADPQNETARQILSDEHVRTGNFGDAIRVWNDAIQRTSGCGALYRNRGMVHFANESFEAAIADFDAAIKLNSTDAIALNNRGAARMKTGDYDAAIADLDQALQLAPEFPNPHRHLAWIQATCPEPQFRDGHLAISNATYAMESINWQPCEWLEVLAAACAESSDFDNAQRWQQSFINALQSEQDKLPASRFEKKLFSATERLQQFQARQPWRDEPCSGRGNP